MFHMTNNIVDFKLDGPYLICIYKIWPHQLVIFSIISYPLAIEWVILEHD